MPEASFERLVELACHDLRTPLATVNGFTKTILRAGELGDLRYVELIDAAAAEMAVLVEQLGLAARVAAGGYDPHLVEANTLELAAASGLPAAGEGAAVETDADTVVRSLRALAAAAVRFGADEPSWIADGRELRLEPVASSAADALDGSAAKDVGALVARAVIAALGGSVELDGESLRVRFYDG
jgi:signal transduction histidine kinase